jgi:hypothetical protein
MKDLTGKKKVASRREEYFSSHLPLEVHLSHNHSKL